MALIAPAPQCGEPLLLAGIVRGELILRGRMNQRRPITGGINLRRLLRGRGIRDLKIDLRAPPGTHTLGVLQPIPAHPQLVGSVRQIGHKESPLIVGDDDLAERHRERLRFRNHPNPGFGLRAVAVQHDAADAILVDLHC